MAGNRLANQAVTSYRSSVISSRLSAVGSSQVRLGGSPGRPASVRLGADHPNPPTHRSRSRPTRTQPTGVCSTRRRSPQSSNPPESKSANKNTADRRLFDSAQITPILQPTGVEVGQQEHSRPASVSVGVRPVMPQKARTESRPARNSNCAYAARGEDRHRSNRYCQPARSCGVLVPRRTNPPRNNRQNRSDSGRHMDRLSRGNRCGQSQLCVHGLSPFGDRVQAKVSFGGVAGSGLRTTSAVTRLTV